MCVVAAQLKEDLPSTELWESLRGFLLHLHATSKASTPDRGTGNSGGTGTAPLDIILSRLRTSASASVVGTCSPILRAVAVDFIVATVRVEAEGRSSSADAGGSSATALDLKVRERDGNARKEEREEGNVRRGGRGDTARGRGRDAAIAAGGGVKAEGTGRGGSTRPGGRDRGPGSAVWCLLDALDTSETDAEKAELIAVLGTPAVADTVLDLEVSESVTKRNAARTGGSASRSKGNALATKQFPLAMAAVENLRMCFPSLAAASARVHLARAVALVSFAAAAFQRAPSSDGDGGAGPRGDALRTLGELAAAAVLCSRPVERLLSGDDGRVCDRGEGLEARVMLSQMRTLAAVHPWPRREMGLAVARRLDVLAPESSVAVELAVLASHVVRAGGDAGGGGGGVTLEGSLWDLLFGRRFSSGNPKVRLCVFCFSLFCGA